MRTPTINPRRIAFSQKGLVDENPKTKVAVASNQCRLFNAKPFLGFIIQSFQLLLYLHVSLITRIHA